MENLREKIKVLYSMEEVQKKIKELGEQISKDYEGKEIVIVSVLKGAIFYTVDLVKNIKPDVVIDFMKVSTNKNSIARKINPENYGDPIEYSANGSWILAKSFQPSAALYAEMHPHGTYRYCGIIPFNPL